MPCFPGQPPLEPNESGPDVPGIECYAPTGCCFPPSCNISEWDFLCQIRSLLPEGDIFNNTLQTQKDPPTFVGVITIGCARVGCEQLVFGACCRDYPPCDDDPIAPQLAVVDAYAASAYRVLQALCLLVRESDACTSQVTIRKWAVRYGLDPKWSDETLGYMLCIWPTLRNRVWNWATLQEIAGLFGADLTLRYAGDFSSCGAPGWWTMARDRNPNCPPIEACPPEAKPRYWPPIMRIEPGCATPPMSLNLIVCPGERRLPENCILPPANKIQPHEPELFEAFMELLPRILPQPVFWCVYRCGMWQGQPDPCIQ